MSATLAGIIGLVLMLALIFAGVELGFAFAAAGFIGRTLFMGPQTGLSLFKSIPLSQAMTYSLSVLPMFMLMGDFTLAGGLTTDAYGAARSFLGRQRAGLANTSTVASAIFGAICGSAQATAMVMSQIAWPEMKKVGYDSRLGLCSIAAAGPLAILIPPSTPMMIFGILSGASVGKLFMAGWIPGIILTLTMCGINIYLATRHKDWAPKTDKTSRKEKIKSLLQAWSILLLVIVIMVCIWGGITTVNEAAGIAVIVTLIIIICKRRCGIKQLWLTLVKSCRGAAGLFFMFIGIQIFNSFLSMTGITGALTKFVTGLPLSRYAIIWAIVVMYLILGMFIDAPVMMTLTIPIVAPVVAALGFDLVWYGIISVLCSALGMITPPVGICLFVIGNQCKDVPLSTVMKNIWPYVIAVLVIIALVIYIPQLALWLPSIMV